jgi:uncharacterized membrane protein
MGLVILIAGLIVMLGAHIFVTFRDARAGAVKMLGLSGYRMAFSLVSLAGLVLIVWGYADYRATGWMQIWTPPAAMRHVTVGLMLISVVLVAAAFVPSHIKMWSKHPMLAGIKIWAFAHLLSNGDLGSIILFGSFLAWAVYARIAARRRGDLGPQSAPAGWTNDILVVAIGVVAYLLLGFYFHPYLIGMPVFASA